MQTVFFNGKSVSSFKMALVIELVIELVRQQRTNRVKGNC
jgi:hypothetical protein